MRPVIVLRPEPGNHRTMMKLQAMGIPSRSLPLFKPQPIKWQPIDAAGFDALLITSPQTVDQAGPDLANYKHLPIYAVGKATAESLERVGFRDVVAGETDGTAIVARMAQDGHRSILHIGGRTTAPIEAGPVAIHHIAVYHMAPMASALHEVMIEPQSILLIHSPNAGRRVAQNLSIEQRSSIHIIAISPAARHACGEGWASAVAAALPNDDAMLALANSLCKGRWEDGRNAPAL